MGGSIESRAALRIAGTLFLVCLAVYTLTNYGGIRSPDNEIVFRAAVTFADRGALYVEQDLESWGGFGVARGRDGRNYPVFGPAQSIALAPWIHLGRALEGTSWYERLRPPPSLYAGNGFFAAMYGAPLGDPRPHALRLVASHLNVVAGAATVALCFLLGLEILESLSGALAAALFLAFGTFFWSYTGACFSEPLAALFTLLSVYGLCRGGVWFVVAGLSLGLATATHVTSILFAPFFAFVPALGDRGARVRGTMHFLAGLCAVLLLLGAYNYARFGSILETGRGVDPEAARDFRYGRFVAPWRGLYGLLLSSGKGLLFYAPAVLVSVLGWRAFHRRSRLLSTTLLAAVAARVVFIAARSDWHGGFCLGPRYLVIALPLLALPIGAVVAERVQRGARGPVIGLAALFILFVLEQAYLCLGEVFTHYHQVKDVAMGRGINVFTGDRLYLDWAYSPLRGMVQGPVGPHLLKGLGIGIAPLSILLTLLITWPLVYPLMRRRVR